MGKWSDADMILFTSQHKSGCYIHWLMQTSVDGLALQAGGELVLNNSLTFGREIFKAICSQVCAQM